MYFPAYIKKVIALLIVVLFSATNVVYASDDSCLSMPLPTSTEEYRTQFGFGDVYEHEDIDFDLLHLKDDSIKAAFADPRVDELHIITAGGGGDVMGGTFLALQLQAMTQGKKFKKIKVFTSNLKRGHENPPGGPLKMNWMKKADGEQIEAYATPEGSAASFYKMENGLYVDVPISDMSATPIKGYNAQIPVSEEKILDILGEHNIELVMSDVGQSGKELADNYVHWMRQEGSLDTVFVVGLDMGGDILARFNGSMDDEGNEVDIHNKKTGKEHSEKGVRSPNTDAVFLDMFAELQDVLQNRIVVGVSAAGGDGELNATLFEYIKDFYEKGDMVGVLDNIGFLASYDPKGDQFGDILKFLLNEIPSEVSGNFLMRLLEVTRIAPILDPALRAKFKDKIEGWVQEFYAMNADRRATDDFVHNVARMAKELSYISEEAKKGSGLQVSRRKIRNGSRTEFLPTAYPYTLFLRPQTVVGRIQNVDKTGADLTDPTDNWYQKDEKLQAKGFQTEKTDKNNVSDRRRVNAILLKTKILQNALNAEGEKRVTAEEYVNATLRQLVDDGTEIFPEVYHDLRALFPILSGDFNWLVSITREVCDSEADRKERNKQLEEWINQKRAYVEDKNTVSFYMFASFCAKILPEVALFFKRQNEVDVSYDEYIDLLENLFSFMEKTVGKSLHSDFTEIFVDELLPAIVHSSRSRDAIRYKCEYLKSYKDEHIASIDYSPKVINYVEVVIYSMLANHYRDESQFDEVVGELRGLHKKLMSLGKSMNPTYVYNIVFDEMMPNLLHLVENDEGLEYSEFFRQMNVLIESVFKESIHPNVQLIVMKYLSRVLSHHSNRSESDSGKSKFVIDSLSDFYSSVRHVLAVVGSNEVAGKDVSGVIRFALRLAESSSNFQELCRIEEQLLATSLFIGLDDHFDRVEKYYGTQYVVPEAVVTEAYQRILAGEDVMEVVAGITMYSKKDYEAPAVVPISDAVIRSELSHAHAVRQLFRTVDNPLMLNDIDPNHTVSLLEEGEFEKEKGIRKDASNAARGLELLQNGAVAFGVSAGYLMSQAGDFMDIDSIIHLRESGMAKGMLEFKIEMLKLSHRVIGLEERMPLLVMSGFTSDVVNEINHIIERSKYDPNGKGLVTVFKQPAVPILDKNGELTSQYKEAGAWGFLRWLVLSGTLAEMRENGFKYITHSNVNNPVQDINPHLIGYFDTLISESNGNVEEQPIALIEFVKRNREEPGGVAVAVKEENGKAVRRVLHKDRFGDLFQDDEGMDVRMNTANYILNIEKLAAVLQLDELKGLESDDEKVAFLNAIEKKYGVNPRVRKVAYKEDGESKDGYAVDYLLDDISLLGEWVGVDVDRENHFIKLKGVKDIQNFANKQMISRVLRKRYVKAFAKESPLLNKLGPEGDRVFTSYVNETVESLRKKVVSLVLPNRIYDEGNEWTEKIVDSKTYRTGLYTQSEIVGTDEELRNAAHRSDKIIRPEVALLCAAYPENEKSKDLNATVIEVEKLLALFMEFEARDGKRLIDEVTNVESNMIVRQCIRYVFFGSFVGEGVSKGADGVVRKVKSYDPYQKFNRVANDIVFERLRRKGDVMGYDTLFREAISAGKIKDVLMAEIEKGNFRPSSDDLYDEVAAQLDAENERAVLDENDIMHFLNTVKNDGQKKLVYVLDDNGEVVYHLYLIQKLLRENPDLEIVLLPRGAQYGVDASYSDVLNCLTHPLLTDLDLFLSERRVSMIESSPLLGGVDLARLSREASKAIDDADCIFSVGSINYEMLSGIKKDSYHLLSIAGSAAQLATGLEDDAYVLRYYPATDTHYLPNIKDVVGVYSEISADERAHIVAKCADVLKGRASVDDIEVSLRFLVRDNLTGGKYLLLLNPSVAVTQSPMLEVKEVSVNKINGDTLGAYFREHDLEKVAAVRFSVDDESFVGRADDQDFFHFVMSGISQRNTFEISRHILAAA